MCFAWTFVLAIFFTKIFGRMLAGSRRRGGPAERYGSSLSRRGWHLLVRKQAEVASSEFWCHLLP